jgi:hypothetical protein
MVTDDCPGHALAVYDLTSSIGTLLPGVSRDGSTEAGLPRKHSRREVPPVQLFKKKKKKLVVFSVLEFFHFIVVEI